MKKEITKQQVIRYLTNKPIANNKEISTLLKISVASAQRLAIELEKEGVLVRFHGGIMLSLEMKNSIKSGINDFSKKQKIAEYVCKNIIKDGQTIYIGSGNTPSLIGEFLYLFKELTIITNNLLLLPSLTAMPHIHCVFTGGSYNPYMPSMVNEVYPLHYLTEKLNIDASFVTVPAVSVKGCSQQEKYFHQVIEEHFLGLPNITNYLLVDNNKLGLNKSFLWAKPEQFSCMITNEPSEESKKLETVFSIMYSNIK